MGDGAPPHVLRARVLTPTSPDTVRYLPDARVVIDAAGRIAEVAAHDGARGDERDVRPGVLLPGFVDAHVHFPQTRIVGAASGPLLTWLEASTFPEEARFVDPEHAARVAAMFCRALAAAGTTLAFAYGSVHPGAADALFEQARAQGLRMIAGPVLMDAHAPAALCLPAREALPAVEALADRWHGAAEGRLEVAVIPRFAPTSSGELLVGAAALAARRGLRVSTHLSETPEECRLACERHDAPDYLAVLERAGLVGPRTVLAHGLHLTPGEWARLGRSRAVLAHCPDSNAFLGSGALPVATALAHDVPLAVGTDVAAGRSFRVPRTLSAAHDNALATGTRIDPRRLFWWGTRGGALALGHPEVGAIEAGLEADLVLLDLPSWATTEDDVLAWTLFDHDAPRPRGTWVRGRRVWDRERSGPGYPWEG